VKATVLILCALIISGAFANSEQMSIEDRVSDLERRVSTLEKASPLSIFKPPPSPTPAIETKAPLELVSWEYHFHRGEYSQFFYAITLSLKTSRTKI
jgi:hypothetical protein